MFVVDRKMSGREFIARFMIFIGMNKNDNFIKGMRERSLDLRKVLEDIFLTKCLVGGKVLP